jgi:ABC-type transporter Mla subunit MlaD
VLRRLTPLAVVVAALALVAAGCGGSDDETSATQEWADGFCTSLTAWTDSLTDIGSSLTDTSNLSADGIKGIVDDAVDSTRQFVDDVTSLGAPETESGAEAQQALETLADQLDESVQTLEDEFSEGADSLTGALSKVSAVTAAVAEMGEDVGTALSSLEEIDAEGELEDTFEQTESCSSFTSS